MIKRSGLFALSAMLAVVLCAGAAHADNGMKPPAHLPGMPNMVLVSPCIPAMGYHYADPKTLPFGPIYGWYNGKMTFTEIMPNIQQLSTMHESWDNILRPLPGYAINHVDIWYEANGHPGYWAPHYDIHAWYVPHSVHMYWCGDKTGQRMDFKQGPHGQVIMYPVKGG
jgi:hypothetical protein